MQMAGRSAYQAGGPLRGGGDDGNTVLPDPRGGAPPARIGFAALASMNAEAEAKADPSGEQEAQEQNIKEAVKAQYDRVMAEAQASAGAPLDSKEITRLTILSMERHRAEWAATKESIEAALQQIAADAQRATEEDKMNEEQQKGNNDGDDSMGVAAQPPPPPPGPPPAVEPEAEQILHHPDVPWWHNQHSGPRSEASADIREKEKQGNQKKEGGIILST